MSCTPVIHSYRQFFDAGFNPNANGGICSMAQCCRSLRRTAKIGDWIIGVVDEEMCPGVPSIVHMMEITGTCSLKEYDNMTKLDEQLWIKRPVHGIPQTTNGDCIYQWDSDGEAYLVRDRAQCATDLEVDRVLLSTNFVYYGKTFLPIPQNLQVLVPKKRREYIQTPVSNIFLGWFNRALIASPTVSTEPFHTMEPVGTVKRINVSHLLS